MNADNNVHAVKKLEKARDDESVNEWKNNVPMALETLDVLAQTTAAKMPWTLRMQLNEPSFTPGRCMNIQ